MSETEIDTFNRFGVSMAAADGSIVLLMPPRGLIPRDQALTMAAWIVALADPLGEAFKKHLDAVMST